MKNKLWVEAYRPQTINDYVFVDDRLKQQVQGWIADGSFPQLLLSGDPGTGKTSLAKVLVNELGIDPYDFMEINTSRERGIDTLRTKIGNFVQTMPFGKFKVILLDEFDYATADFQAALRNDMEAFADTARFILTCNYPQKIIPALRDSRCHHVHISKPDMTEFTARVATVLVNENVDFDLDNLDSYVRASYPDLRKCLNLLQVNSQTGKLLQPQTGNTSTGDDILLTATNLFKAGKIVDARMQLQQYIAVNPTRIEDLYVWCYSNLDLWGDTQEKKDAAIIAIRNGLANLPLVGIPEISLAATLIELTTL